jgi:hypothetical protein
MPGILLQYGRFSLEREREIPENPEIPEIFPARKSDITGFPAGDILDLNLLKRYQLISH